MWPGCNPPPAAWKVCALHDLDTMENFCCLGSRPSATTAVSGALLHATGGQSVRYRAPHAQLRDLYSSDPCELVLRTAQMYNFRSGDLNLSEHIKSSHHHEVSEALWLRDVKGPGRIVRGYGLQSLERKGVLQGSWCCTRAATGSPMSRT